MDQDAFDPEEESESGLPTQFEEQGPFEQDEALWDDAGAADDPAPSISEPGPPATEVAAPLALYRRYRPDTFSDVIGQDHVTAPLQRALANNRVNHAYLFSGPRGCGKTTSARILARALNCAEGPTPEPCGHCQSCRDLARGGPGSIDVIEIDAASHGGVDDARDLRERAFFAPVQSRYKIYIVDEAHMVTTAGFNALLKLVEEPPPHVKFIFATTEPEKVIGTIRSRTHHYPFRLVPPKTLSGHLAQLCEAEGIAVEPAVLPLVVRAGAGSVRDSLSVLDQLLGGAEDGGVSYLQATGLLGYTPDSLLDEVVDAFAAGDGGAVFAGIDKIIEVGQDPRRFAEDLLRRMRDLLVVAQVPDAMSSGLIDVAGDQAERLRSQSAALGAGELTRAAEVVARGLTDMRGTTAPRLHLELMCSRVLLPGADVDDRGLHARLDRLERRMGMDAADDRTPAEATSTDPTPGSATAAETSPSEPAQIMEAAAESSPQPAAESDPQPAAEPAAARVPESTRVLESNRASPPAPDSGSDPGGPVGLNTAEVRRLWPDVLERIKARRRFTWVLLSQNAQVADVTDGTVTLSMPNAGARDSFGRGGSEDLLREAMAAALGVDLKVEVIVDAQSSAQVAAPPPRRPQPDAASGSPVSAGSAAPQPPADPDRSAATRDRIRPTRTEPEGAGTDEDEPEPVDAGEDSLTPAEILSRHLGAELIGEEPTGKS